MSAIRKLQRDVIRSRCYKQNSNKKAFKHEWEKFHYGQIEEKDNDGNVIGVKINKVEKQKRRHNDDGRTYMKYLKAWKSMIDNMKTNKSNAREKVC